MNSEWIAFAGIAGTLLAGIGGPVLQDRRRYAHDAKLRSGDDLLTVIDAVAVAVEELADAAVELRTITIRNGPAPATVTPVAMATNAAYQRARFTVARLRMRPHADADLIEKATAAADAFLATYKAAWAALVAKRSPIPGSGVDAVMLIAEIPALVENGYRAQRDYEKSAQRLLRELRGGSKERLASGLSLPEITDAEIISIPKFRPDEAYLKTLRKRRHRSSE